MNWVEGKRKLLEQLYAEIESRLPAEKAKPLLEFARLSYQSFPPDELRGRQVSDLYGSLLGSWNFAQDLPAREPKVRVFNPDYEQHGWQLGHTAIAVLGPHMPFALESIRGELNSRNITIFTIHSFSMRVLRDEQHNMLRLLDEGEKVKTVKGEQIHEELLIYLEISRHTDKADLDLLRQALVGIVKQVELVVNDFAPMTECLDEVIADFDKTHVLDAELKAESMAFLQWIRNGHFTFLGYQKLLVDWKKGEPTVSSDANASLGLLTQRNSTGLVELERTLAQTPKPDELITFSKSSVRSKVHRRVYPHYFEVTLLNSAGKVSEQHRFLGLYTSRAYTLTPTQIPMVRRKVEEVLQTSGLERKSHECSELLRVLETYPRDELFLSSTYELAHSAMAITRIMERRQTRLFVRRDPRGKFVSCIVYVPRDRYHTQLRSQIQQILCDAFGAEEAEFTTYFSESILTRTHFVLRVNPQQPKEQNVQQLEEEIVEVTLSWHDHLRNHLLEEFGEEQGTAIANNYEGAFGPGYQTDFDPRAGVNDIRRIDTLNEAPDIAMSFYRMMGEQENALRFRLMHLNDPLPLSDVMPILENLGLRVVGEHPYEINCRDGKRVWVHEFSLIYNLADTIDVKSVSKTFQESFARIWFGDAESDSFNKLIIGTQMGWRSVALLRAYAKYMRQIRFNFSSDFIAETLTRHLDLTKALVELFRLRFDPVKHNDERAEALELRIQSALDDVENLSEDRVIRHYVALIKATLRTNFYQKDKRKQLKNYFSFKLQPSLIPNIPQPCPAYEIFVYSPRVEGVHLRGGKVARGGLRWSDRIEDFRTEVLGLVKAQQVKNAVIVPTGAKGGFIAKQLAQVEDREARQAEGIACYKTFIQGLLDITDNLQAGKVVAPTQVVRKDDDDPYLVVAADKGTATFSDIANQISEQYGFWMADAFASGGSAGYDHKEMGITARGAWVSVQRHFREMGINIQTTDFTVVGIGDMAGDVFGNGMLLSEHIQLVAAFNHMHIFVDPNPDSARSFVERKRLFELPRSSWEDYNAELISKGGGVFRRSAKSIVITPEMKARFAIQEDRLTPAELITALLKAPVDLLWNGGIGTYVKARSESHADVGDKANDGLRINGGELRCKVVGEGGNLGMTQLGRIEYALKGGLSNTDFIDNVGGVDCSDHEVNIKILLNTVVANGDMTRKQRDQLLEQMTEAVSELVLRNSYRQVQAISLASREAFRRFGEYHRLIHQMESSGRLKRSLEFIPDDDALAERKASGKALTRPELSVLISYAKSQLKEQLVCESIADDGYLATAVESAFPAQLTKQFKEPVYQHQLRREIIATQIANDLVNQMGITFIERLIQSTGASPADLAAAYIASRDIFEMPAMWQAIEALDHQVDSKIQMEMMAELMRLVRRGTRWFIRNRRSSFNPGEEVSQFLKVTQQLRGDLPALAEGESRQRWEQSYNRYVSAGVPEELASSVAACNLLYPCLGIAEVAGELTADPYKVAEVYFTLSEELKLDWFIGQIAALKIENHWQALARESYRDDLEWQLRALTCGAMRHLCKEGDVPACLTRWTDQHSVLVERWHAMLTELQAADTHEFAMYSVAIRELLDLAQSTKFDDIPA